MKRLFLTIVAFGTLIAVNSCTYEAPEIYYEQTITNDYTGVVKALQDQTRTLEEKLALLESAMKNQTLSLEQKLDLLKKGLDDQNMSLSQKLDLLTAAVNNGVIKYEEMTRKLIESIDAMKVSNAEKLEAVEKAVKEQASSLAAKLALIEAAVQKGLVDTGKSLELVKDAIDALEGTVEEKLKAVESAIKDQKVELGAKLSLIQGALEAGFVKSAEALELVKDAIDALEGTVEEKLKAVESAIKDQKVELGAKLSLIQGALEAGFVKNAEALELVKDAIDALEGTVEEKLKAVESAIKDQKVELGAKLSLIQGALEAGFVKNAEALELVKDAIDALEGTVEEKLKAVENAVRNQSTSLADKLTLIDQTLNTKLTDIKSQQVLIKDAVNSLKGDYAAALADLKAAVSSMTSTLETKLGAIKTSVDEGVLDITEGQKLIQEAIENSTTEGTSVTGGFNKDEILDLNLKKGCIILTTEFWNKYYNKTDSDEYKKISALLDATLPIPADTKLDLKLYYVDSEYDQPFYTNRMDVDYSNLKITPDTRYEPMLLVANVDKEWSGSAMRHISATSGLMMLGKHFAFSYKNRSACAVYKVNYMAVISFSTYSAPLIYSTSFPSDGSISTGVIYPDGLKILAYSIKTVSFGKQYCNRNDRVNDELELAYRLDKSPAFAGIDNVSLTVDLRGNGVFAEYLYIGGTGSSYSYTTSFHSDLPLKHIFTYTDSRKDNLIFTFLVDEIGY